MKINPQPLFQYDSVRVGPSTPLAAIGKAANASVSQMQDLNPQILRGMTPPKDSMFVRIPVGAADSFAVAFDALPKSDRTALVAVESKKGQSLASIAAKNDISARQLAVYNPSLRALKSGNLAPGQTVLIPTEAVVAAATAAPDPAIEHWGSASSKSVTTHVVRSGESLGSIAKKYHTTTAAIMRANGMKHAVIFPGQSIVVKSSSSSKHAALASSAKSSSKSGSTKVSATKVASASGSRSAKASAKSAKTTVAKSGSKSGGKSATVAKGSTKKSLAVPVATAGRLKKPSVEKVSEKGETKGKKKRQS
jgi:LysM repeat protein